MANEKRLIDIDDLIEDLGCSDFDISVKELLEVVWERTRVDAVEVVRCKDCKYIRPEVDAYTHEVVGHWCSLLDLGSVEYEHFCSYGERREGDA